MDHSSIRPSGTLYMCDIYAGIQVLCIYRYVGRCYLSPSAFDPTGGIKVCQQYDICIKMTKNILASCNCFLVTVLCKLGVMCTSRTLLGPLDRDQNNDKFSLIRRLRAAWVRTKFMLHSPMPCGGSLPLTL